MANRNTCVSVKFCGKWKATEARQSVLLAKIFDWIRELYQRTVIETSVDWITDHHFIVFLNDVSLYGESTIDAQFLLPLTKEYEPEKFIVLENPVTLEAHNVPVRGVVEPVMLLEQLTEKMVSELNKLKLNGCESDDRKIATGAYSAGAASAMYDRFQTSDVRMVNDKSKSKGVCQNDSQNQRCFKVRPAGKQYARFNWVECEFSDTLNDTIANVAKILSGFFDQQTVVVENLKDCDGSVINSVSDIVDGECILAVISITTSVSVVRHVNDAVNFCDRAIGAGISNVVATSPPVQTVLHNFLSFLSNPVSFAQVHTAPISVSSQPLQSTFTSIHCSSPTISSGPLLCTQQSVVSSSNSRMQQAFWSFFVGQLSDSDIKEKLENISKTTDLNLCTNFEADYLRSILDAPSPLVAAVGPLLSMARRFQPWNSFLEKLDDLNNNLCEFDVDSKSVLVLLQHFLPPLKSKQLYEQFSVMQTPLPFAVCAHDLELSSMVCTADNTVLTKTYVLALHFRELFADNIPIVLSIGLAEISGKSTFVNKCFDCSFEERSENRAFHHGSIDVSVSTKRKQLNFHIFDCHCDVMELDAGLLKSLVNISSIVLLHISMTSFENTEQLIETLEVIGDRCSVILLLRDTPSSTTSGQLLLKLPVRISEHVKLICVPRLTQGRENFNRSFRKLVEAEVCPCIQQALAGRSQCGATHTRYFSLYEFIEQQFKTLMTAGSCFLKSRTDNIVSLSDSLKELLFALPPEEKLARVKLFPLSALHSESCKIEEQLLKQSHYLECQPERFTALKLRLSDIEKQLKQCKEKHWIIDLLLNIAECSDVEAYTEFQAIVSCFNFSCDNTGSVTLPVELFWREIFLISKHNKLFKQTSLIHFQKLLLSWGFPLEIVNGDTLTLLDLNLMSLILSSVTSKELLVCSVLGPQSSGKSTLCNTLFGSNFVVSAGRCTQGMQMSLFESLGRDDPCLVVLDSEGLLSIETRGGAFDTKMALMLLALSHVVLINVKGEIGIEMKNVLEVTLLALKKLDVINAQPTLVFVLRDMADLNISKQKESIVRIENGMKEICNKIGLDFSLVNEHSFILLPSAFNDCPVSYFDGNRAFFYKSKYYYSQSDQFSNCLEGVMGKIRSAKERTSGTSVPFVSLADWASHANSIWEVLRVSGEMLYYKTLQEYFDRIQLSGLVASLVQEIFAGQLFASSKKAERGILSDLRGSSGASDKILRQRFVNAVTDLKEQFLCMAMQRFDAAVGERSYQEELVDEYRNCLKRRAEMFVNTCIHEFDYSIGSFFVSESIRENIEAVKHWIDNYSSTDARPDETKQIAEFIAFWERQTEHMRKRQLQLKKDPRDIEDHLNSSINIVLKSMPAFHRFNIAKINDAVAIVDLLVSEAGTTGINCETLQSYVSFSMASRVRNFVSGQDLTRTVQNTFQHFVVQLRRRVEDYLTSFKKVCNDTQIHRGLQIVDENICDTENQLHNNGCRFKGAVYGLCFSYFYYRCFDKFTEEENMSIAENLSKFESYRDVLQNAFVRLLRSRFDDIDSVQHISESFVRSLEDEATKFVSEECAVCVRTAGYISSDELVELCENRGSKAEILEYILNCTSFMQQVFNENFESRMMSLQSEFNGKLKTKIRDYVQLLENSIKCWSDIVSGSSFAVLWKNLQKSADSAAVGSNFGVVDIKTVAIFLFKSLKAFITSTAQPTFRMSGQPWDELMKCLADLESKSQQSPELHKLFDLLPGNFHIYDPEKFSLELLSSIRALIAERSIVFKPDYCSLDVVRKTMAKEAIGCQKKCGLCRAKCSLPDDGHQKHKTESHRMTSFAGWHVYNTKKFCFKICTSEGSRTASYMHYTNEDEVLTFDQYMTKYHPDWIIQYEPDSKVSTKNILRWLRVRKELVAHYNLDDNTPKHWLEYEQGYCPLCIEMWGSCGNKRSLSCGHEIGANCMDALYARPASEQFCPLCRGPLS